jgi:hypothetical protein
MKKDVSVQAKLKTIKIKLADTCKGRIMVRECKSYPGLTFAGIFRYNVYFESLRDKGAIIAAIESEEIKPLGIQIQGGIYGHVIGFELKQ